MCSLSTPLGSHGILKGPMRGVDMEGNGIKDYMEIMREQGLSSLEK